MWRAAFVSFLALFAVSCSSQGSSTLPTPSTVAPYIVQTGSQNGWVHFPVPPNGLGVMVNGQDGNVWSTLFGFAVRISMDGSMQEFNDTNGQYLLVYDRPHGVTFTANPNGNFYGIDSLSDGTFALAQVTTQGVITDYPLPGTKQPQWITTASDGSIWMIRAPGSDNEAIAKISPDGTGYTEYPHGQSNDYLGLITSGPDGNIWGFNGLPYRNVGLVRISTADGSIQDFPAPSDAKSLVAMPDGGLWEGNCQPYLTRFDTNGNAQQFPLTLDGKPVAPCILAAGPSNQLYWAGQTHVLSFNIYTHAVQRYGALQRGIAGTPLIGPDQNFWGQECCFDNQYELWVYLLHQVVAKPSSVTVQAGSSASLSVTEKRGPKQTFTAVSNNSAIATVSGSGHTFTVTGVSVGSTTITVSDSIGNSLDVAVTVQ